MEAKCYQVLQLYTIKEDIKIELQNLVPLRPLCSIGLNITTTNSYIFL